MLLTPILERWRMLLVTSLLAALVTVGIVVLLVPRRYEASTTAAAVMSQRTPGSLSGLAALSGLTLQTGFQATPDLVADILVSRRVLLAVADTPAVAGARTTVAERLLKRPKAEIPTFRAERAMREIVDVSVAKRTGLISVKVQHRDSALARTIASRVLDVGAETFSQVARAQAAAQRRGLEKRVSVAEQHLRGAELRLVAFIAGNRVLSAASPAIVERQRLERDVTVAQQSYAQAVAERETAAARELEDAPVVVVVDSLPRSLTPVPRYAAFYGLATALLALFVTVSLILLQDFVRRARSGADDSHGRLAEAITALPVIGRLARGRDARARRAKRVAEPV